MCMIRKFKLYLYGIEIRYNGSNLGKKGKFKLYLYGIEIQELHFLRAARRAFKLYLYGIEITLLTQAIRLNFVQIVPLWN